MRVSNIWQDPHVPLVCATIATADLQLQRQLCKYRAVMAGEAKRHAVGKIIDKTRHVLDATG